MVRPALAQPRATAHQPGDRFGILTPFDFLKSRRRSQTWCRWMERRSQRSRIVLSANQRNSYHNTNGNNKLKLQLESLSWRRELHPAAFSSQRKKTHPPLANFAK